MKEFTGPLGRGNVLKRDYRDIVAGVALSVFGLSAAVYAVSKYSMGTIKRMGPGMAPVSLLRHARIFHDFMRSLVAFVLGLISGVSPPLFSSLKLTECDSVTPI